MRDLKDCGASLPPLNLTTLLGGSCGSTKPCAWCGKSILRGNAELEAISENGTAYHFHPLCIHEMQKARS